MLLPALDPVFTWTQSIIPGNSGPDTTRIRKVLRVLSGEEDMDLIHWVNYSETPPTKADYLYQIIVRQPSTAPGYGELLASKNFIYAYETQELIGQTLTTILHIESYTPSYMTAIYPGNSWYYYDTNEDSLSRSYPLSTLTRVFAIRTVSDLLELPNHLTEYCVQMADIDLSSIPSWTPIGTWDYPFTGTYDGNGFKISNLTIVDGGQNSAFFKEVEDSGRLKNITIENASISGSNDCAILVGYCHSAEKGPIIYNCHVSGSVTTAWNGCAGLIAWAEGNWETRMAARCSANVTLRGQSNVGAFCSGAESGGGVLESCCAIVDIVASGNNVGGLFGHGYSAFDCYTRGSIVANNYVGGLCGDYYDNISNCYSTCSVVATQDGWPEDIYAGGLVGYG